MQRVVIIGASSGVAEHFIKEYQNEYEIIAVARNLSRTKQNALVQYHEADVTSSDALDKIVMFGDVVINLIYLRNASDEANLHYIKMLLSVCERKSVKRLIHYSSIAVYGTAQREVIYDDSVCLPNDSYGMSKLVVDQCLLESTKLELAILRPSVIFGLNCEAALNKMIDDLSEGNKLKDYVKTCVSSKILMHLVAVENLVVATKKILDQEKLESKIFIVSDDDQSNNNYGYVHSFVASKLAKKFFLPAFPLSLFLYTSLYKLSGKGSINPMARYETRNLKKIGYKPVISLEQSLEKYFDKS